MAWQRPSPRLVWKAIHVYLACAYDGPADGLGVPGDTPSAVRHRLDTLRSTPDESFYDCPVFERGPIGGRDKDPAAPPAKYALRLGNRAYPHMKLVIDRAPDGRSYLIRADTHDAHVQPKPGSRDYAAFQELALTNRAVAERIETGWEGEGLPTFKKFLRDDLEQRRRAAGGAAVAEIRNPKSE